jgi:predicted Rossmann-fold nucleotide-binding protein
LVAGRHPHSSAAGCRRPNAVVSATVGEPTPTDGRNAVIYGGGGAIGGAVARAFAREGARVHLAAELGPHHDRITLNLTCGAVPD